MSKTEIDYELQRPILYTPDNTGNQVEGSFIKLKEPSAKVINLCAPLKQAFIKAVSEASTISTGVDDTPSVEIKQSEMVINAMYACHSVDMEKVLINAMELFKQVGEIEGHKRLTDPMVKSMKIEDIEGALGEYMVNFIIASVLN